MKEKKEKRGTRRGVIPDPVKTIIIDMYLVQNKHVDEILVYLKNEHNVTTTAANLYHFFGEERKLRADIALEVKKEDIKHSVTSILKKVDTDIEFLGNEFEKIWVRLPEEDKDIRAALKLKELQVKLFELRLRCNGMLEDNDKLSTAIEQLNSKLGL